jgi:predicted DsbA family dithiol-disulfide isomerase
VALRWRAFPLHPETPPEGRSLEELFAGRDLDLPAMQERLRQTAQSLGLPWSPREMTCNSRRAQKLGKWAESQGRGEEFHSAAFAAYFVHGRNLHRRQTLRQVAAEAGLDPDQAVAALDEPRWAREVDADWDLSRRLGITAVPTFARGGRALVGFQPYPALAALARGESASPQSLL